MRDMLLLVQVVFLVWIAPLLMRLPIRTLDSLLSKVHGPEPADETQLQKIIMFVDAVCRRGKRCIPRHCVARGISLLYLLRRAGLPVTLVFGVAQGADGGEGHCWLALRGRVYAEKIDPHDLFTPMVSLADAAGIGVGATLPVEQPLYKNEQSTFVCRLHGLHMEFAGPEPIIEAVAARFKSFPDSCRTKADLHFEYTTLQQGTHRYCVKPEGKGRPFYDPDAGEATYFSKEDCCYLKMDSLACALCLPTEGACTVALGGPASGLGWVAAHPLLTLPLLEMLKRRDIFFVHAASLALNGRCLLLAGGSGSGKSTLSVALLQAGFSFMGDDLALLDGIEASRILAFPEPVSVTTQTARLFPQSAVAIQELPLAGYPKHEISAAAWSSLDICWDALPAALVFPEIAHVRASVLSPMNSDEAFSRLSSNLLLTDRGSTQRHLDALASLAKGVPAFRLRTGTDFGDVAERLRALIQ